MHQMINIVLRFPLIFIVAMVSLLLVAGLLLSGWSEKRRQRRLLKLVERSRLCQQDNKPLPIANAATLAGAGEAGRGQTDFAATFFRSRFIWPAMVCITVALILLEVWTPGRTARARAVRDTTTEGPGPAGTNNAGRGGRNSLATRLFTNDWDRSGEAPTFGFNQVHLESQTRSGKSPARVTVSAPKVPLTDPNLPSAVDWSVVKSVRPDPSEVPQPPPTPRVPAPVR